MIDRVQIIAIAAGPDGTATATAYSPHVSGRVLKVALAYSGSPPGTTDVTLQDEGDPGAENIVNIANANTDIALYPRRAVQDNTNADLTFDGTRNVPAPYLVHGRLKLTIAGANAGSAVTALVWLRP